jgi:hypothetical protein
VLCLPLLGGGIGRLWLSIVTRFHRELRHPYASHRLHSNKRQPEEHDAGNQ